MWQSWRKRTRSLMEEFLRMPFIHMRKTGRSLWKTEEKSRENEENDEEEK